MPALVLSLLLSFSALALPRAPLRATAPVVDVQSLVKMTPQLANLKLRASDLKTLKANLDKESQLKSQALGQRIVFPADRIPGNEVLDWLRASPELDETITQNRTLRVAYEKFFLKVKSFYVFEIESNQTTCTGSDYRFISDDFSVGIAMNLSGCN